MKAKADVNSQNPRPCPAPTQTTITATLHRAEPHPSTSQRRAEITDAISFYLAKDMCPINTVSTLKVIRFLFLFCIIYHLFLKIVGTLFVYKWCNKIHVFPDMMNDRAALIYSLQTVMKSHFGLW